MGGTIGLPKGFRVSPFLIASSGIPFNITTGADPYQDSQFNVRPVFAPCATAVYVTKFGCFRDGIPERLAILRSLSITAMVPGGLLSICA